MQLRTYTGLWNVKKRLYKFYDVNLPYPVTLSQIGIFFGSAVPWMLFLNIINFPFKSPLHVVWLAPPALLTWYSNRPVAEEKLLSEYVISQVGFWLSPKTYAALEPTSDKPVVVHISGVVWRSQRF